MIVFIDTSAFFAVLTKSDNQYADAAAYWKMLLEDPDMTLVTSNYIIVETCALLRNRLGKRGLEVFVHDILPAISILWIDEAMHFAAVEAMLAFGGNGPSLVDCSSFALLDAKGITRVFAYDQHFSARGFLR